MVADHGVGWCVLGESGLHLCATWTGGRGRAVNSSALCALGFIRQACISGSCPAPLPALTLEPLTSMPSLRSSYDAGIRAAHRTHPCPRVCRVWWSMHACQ